MFHQLACLIIHSSSHHAPQGVVVGQSLRRVPLFVTPWTAACQASLSFTICWSLLKFMSVELVMPSNHLILCHPLLLLSSIFSSIRVFSSESAHCIRWLKYWRFSLSISPFNEHPRIDVFELWCWRRFLRVPRTARRSNQSFLNEINPEYSLKGLMLRLKHQYFGHLMIRTDSLEETRYWE